MLKGARIRRTTFSRTASCVRNNVWICDCRYNSFLSLLTKIAGMESTKSTLISTNKTLSHGIHQNFSLLASRQLTLSETETSAKFEDCLWSLMSPISASLASSLSSSLHMSLSANLEDSLSSSLTIHLPRLLTFNLHLHGPRQPPSVARHRPL